MSRPRPWPRLLMIWSPARNGNLTAGPAVALGGESRDGAAALADERETEAVDRLARAGFI
jgi:hypothetical protein